MDWNLTTILTLVGVLLAGYGIGLLEMHLRRQRKIRLLEEALRAEKAKTAAASLAASSSAAAPAPPAAPAPGPGGLRLWNDDAGALRLELDNVRPASPAALTPEQRRRIVALLTQVRPWLEGGPVAPAAPGLRSAPAAAKVIEPPPPPPSKSIVGQINDVLQARLVGTPLASRQIRLAETLSGGVRVFIGMQSYEGIDAVPDPEVVAAIRAAIAEWEKNVQIGS